MKSSEGLEALNKLIINWGLQLNPQWEKDIAKELIVLKIIKKKKVNIDILEQCKDVETYNKCVHYIDRQLEKQVFDLLKEVLL